LTHGQAENLCNQGLELSVLARIFTSMLEHGASRFTTCTWNHTVASRVDQSMSSCANRHTIDAVIDNIFGLFQGTELKTLLNDRIIRSASQMATVYSRMPTRRGCVVLKSKQYKKGGHLRDGKVVPNDGRPWF